MPFEPWMLAAMESEGYMDTKEGLINRLVRYFKNGDLYCIEKDDFIAACEECGINPNIFDSQDLAALEWKLNH